MHPVSEKTTPVTKKTGPDGHNSQNPRQDPLNGLPLISPICRRPPEETNMPWWSWTIFSKYVQVYPIPNQKTETVLEALFNWIYEFGVPERLHSDQGRQFESDLFQMMCKKLGIRKTWTTPYHPESDGMVERFMRTLKDMVAKFISGEGLSWDENVKAYTMAYNSSVHATTGQTPFFIIHGFEPRLPLDVIYGPPAELVTVRSFLADRLGTLRNAYQRAQSSTMRAAEKAAKRYDRSVCENRYRQGEEVWVRDHTAAAGGKPKLGLPYAGPATIIGEVGTKGEAVTYKIRDQKGRVRVVHHNHLKPVVRGKDVDALSNGPDQNTDKEVLHTSSLTTGPSRTWRGSSEEGMSGEEIAFLLMNQDAGSSKQHKDVAALPTPYITRSGRISRPVSRYQAGGSSGM